MRRGEEHVFFLNKQQTTDNGGQTSLYGNITTATVAT